MLTWTRWARLLQRHGSCFIARDAGEMSTFVTGRCTRFITTTTVVRAMKRSWPQTQPPRLDHTVEPTTRRDSKLHRSQSRPHVQKNIIFMWLTPSIFHDIPTHYTRHMLIWYIYIYVSTLLGKCVCEEGNHTIWFWIYIAFWPTWFIYWHIFSKQHDSDDEENIWTKRSGNKV